MSYGYQFISIAISDYKKILGKGVGYYGLYYSFSSDLWSNCLFGSIMCCILDLLYDCNRCVCQKIKTSEILGFSYNEWK